MQRRWPAAHARGARLAVLDAGTDPALWTDVAARLAATGVPLAWHGPGAGGIVHAIDAPAGRIETDAGTLAADVANFVPPHGAAKIAHEAGLTGPDGWCPTDASGRSTLRPGIVILGDARSGAERTRSGAVAGIGAAL